MLAVSIAVMNPLWLLVYNRALSVCTMKQMAYVL